MLGILNGPITAAYHLVTGLALWLSPLGPSLATALAIVVFTILVRLVLSPLSFFAFGGQASMSRLQPKVAALRSRFAGQPERLQRELTELYRTEGGGMLTGCLPLLLQLPFFSVMYRLFRSATVAGKPSGLLSRELLGAPLGSHWLSGGGPASAQGLVFLGLFALIGMAAFLAARAARKAGPPPAAGAAPPAGMAALTRILPYSTLIIAAFAPLAAGIYLLTTTLWTTAERAVIRRLHPAGRQTMAVSAAEPGNAGPAGRRRSAVQPR
jgi:YidC/Oxa1 family membrane protein insertase